MKNQVNMHPIIYAATLVIAGIAGAGIVHSIKPQPKDPIEPACPEYSAVGIPIDVGTAEAYYNAFVQNDPESVRYMTLSLDDLNDMNVVSQNAKNSGIDLREFKLYFGMEQEEFPFLMVSGVTGSGNITTPVYQMAPDGTIGPCPHMCDAGRGLPPPTF